MWEKFKFACIVLGVALGYFGFCSLIGAVLGWLDATDLDDEQEAQTW